MKGFLGYQPMFMLDFVLISQVVVLPLLAFALWQARKGNYRFHSRMMVFLTAVLTIVVVLFEVQVRLYGGLSEIAKELGREAQVTSFAFRSLFFTHLLVAGLLTPLWLYLIYGALKHFGWKEPCPHEGHSRRHRTLGYVALAGALFLSLSGVFLYVMAFVW